ncbi:hypothetical protein Syun_016352 [Stephania yunnanensis]|uniref:Uncharacterized protein n=1 Tax=Stephania yunnanensis TaxID=152371 RepID=A0AAP0P3T6_9MAGN
MEGLWRLMWPPKACPDENSEPQTEHSCTLALLLLLLLLLLLGLLILLPK